MKHLAEQLPLALPGVATGDAEQLDVGYHELGALKQRLKLAGEKTVSSDRQESATTQRLGGDIA